jgi:hypothetical protein
MVELARRVRRRRDMSVLARRTGAVLAVGSAVLHGFSLGETNTGIAVLTVAMLVGCLYCAYELWTRDTVRSWVSVAVMNLAMIGVHLPMVGGHHHGGGPVVASATAPTSMQLATFVAIVEVLFAATVLFVRARKLAPLLPDHGGSGLTARPLSLPECPNRPTPHCAPCARGSAG